MASTSSNDFRFTGVLLRVAFSLALVFLTFNPSGHSYFHWLAANLSPVQPLVVIAGIVLLGAWLFFVRATFSSMGLVGVVLLLALFASIVWWFIGFDERAIWDVAAVAAFFNTTNRMATAVDMMPNPQYHSLDRRTAAADGSARRRISHVPNPFPARRARLALALRRRRAARHAGHGARTRRLPAGRRRIAGRPLRA